MFGKNFTGWVKIPTIANADHLELSAK